MIDAKSRPQNAILRSLPAGEFARLSPLLERVPLKPRRVLHYPHEPIEHVYFVERGLVSVLANAGQGKNVEVWLIGPEGVAGFNVVLGQASSAHRRVVQIEGDALRIHTDDLMAAMATLGSLRRVLLQYIQAVIMQTSQLGVCNATHDVGQRVARWLIMAQDRCQTDALPITHEMLSRILGVRRATITRCIRRYEDAGILSKSRSMIRIRGRARLEAIACACYGYIRAADEWLMLRCGNYKGVREFSGAALAMFFPILV
jgi:CRP-like cAMP-binding protein